MENNAKTFPNPSQNHSKSIEKPSENAKKRNFEASCEKVRKKFEKNAILEPTWSQLGLPKQKKTLPRRDTRRPLRGASLHQKAWDHLNPTIQHTRGTRPPRIEIVYASRIPPRRRRTSNVRLPLELRSDRHETSATRVSDDLQISIF